MLQMEEVHSTWYRMKSFEIREKDRHIHIYTYTSMEEIRFGIGFAVGG